MADDGRMVTILVVDDDPLLRNLLTAVLSGAQLDIHEAADGHAAVKMAEEIVPDVVLLDVMMPGMDGYATCRALRKTPSLAKTRIIILTARSDARDRDEAMQAGADAFFTKPFSPLELMDRILERERGET